MKYYIPLGSEVWAVKKIPTFVYTDNNEKFWIQWQVYMDKVEHKDERIWWSRYKRILTTVIHLSEYQVWNNKTMPDGMYAFIPLDHEEWLGYILPVSKIIGGI